MLCLPRPHLLRHLLIGLLASTTLWSADRNHGPVVELPPFVVEDNPTSPWRYTETDEVQMLSRTPDRLTRQLLTSHYRLHELLALLIPKEFQVQRDHPIQYVLYIAENQSADMRKLVASIEQQERETKSAQTSRFDAADTTVGFMPNFRFWDQDSLSIFFVIDLNSNDREEITLAASYVRSLLESRTPTLPLWYIEGIMEIYPGAIFSEPPLSISPISVGSGATTKNASVRRQLSLKPLVWITKSQSKSLGGKSKAKVDFIPWPTLFSATEIDSWSPDRQALWRAQSALFIRWTLEPGKNRKEENSRSQALQEFVRRSITESPTESLFQECFGMSFADIETEMRRYLPSAVGSTISIYPTKTQPIPEFQIDDATPLESGLLKGGLARQEISYIRARYPALTATYVDQARLVLRKVYDQGYRDSALLAEMGLCEVDAGDDAAAFGYLRESTRLGVIRPRAYYELARIEYARLVSGDAEPAERAGILGRVSKLLHTVRQQAPSIPDAYELYTRIWIDQNTPVTPERTAIVQEGLRQHPRNYRFIIAAALWHLTQSDHAGARDLIERGFQITGNPAERAKLQRLQNILQSQQAGD